MAKEIATCLPETTILSYTLQTILKAVLLCNPRILLLKGLERLGLCKVGWDFPDPEAR